MRQKKAGFVDSWPDKLFSAPVFRFRKDKQFTLNSKSPWELLELSFFLVFCSIAMFFVEN